MKTKQEKFADKYRPTSIEDFVLPTRHTLQPVLDFLQSPEPSAWLLHGKSGLGKTSMAHIMASAAANSTDPNAISTYPGQDLDAALVRQLKLQSKQGSLFGDRNVFVINEAHTIPSGGMDRLLDVLEDSGEACWFFTTTEDPETFTSGFISRVTPVLFTSQGICAPAANWLVKIAQKEGLELSLTEAEFMIKEARNNLRTALGSLQVLCRRAQLNGALSFPCLPPGSNGFAGLAKSSS